MWLVAWLDAVAVHYIVISFVLLLIIIHPPHRHGLLCKPTIRIIYSLPANINTTLQRWRPLLLFTICDTYGVHRSIDPPPLGQVQIGSMGSSIRACVCQLIEFDCGSGIVPLLLPKYTHGTGGDGEEVVDETATRCTRDITMHHCCSANVYHHQRTGIGFGPLFAMRDRMEWLIRGCQIIKYNITSLCQLYPRIDYGVTAIDLLLRLIYQLAIVPYQWHCSICHAKFIA